MGVNILLYKIEGIEEFKDQYPECLYKQFRTSTPDWWDHSRYGGDREFCRAIEFDQRVDGDDGEPDIDTRVYNRPSDLDAAISWVKENIHEGNQERLIRVLEEMKKDLDLWFYLSY